jgi:hypothetical protein
MRQLVILLLCGMFLVSACGYIEGTVEKAERSYIVFLGELEQVKVQIDSMEPFTPSAGKQYQISPGRHTVAAFKNETMVLKRIVLLENNVITEIRIP